MSEKVLLVGPGAIGVYFAGRLAQSGAEVAVVARGNCDSVLRDGYRIESICGDFQFRPAGVYRTAADYPGAADWIVIATKVLPEIDLPAMIRGAIRSKNTRILLIQNGIGIEEKLHAAFPDNPLYSAIAYIGATRIAPGVISHQGGGKIAFGRYGDLPPEPEALALETRFRNAAVEVSTSSRISLLRWRKLLWNAPFNPLSVIGGGLKTNEMTDGGEFEKLCFDLMAEIVAIARAAGVPLEDDQIRENIEYTRNFPPYKTSMLNDYEAGRPLEVDAILGNPLAVARRHGVSAPKLEALTALLRKLDAKNRARA